MWEVESPCVQIIAIGRRSGCKLARSRWDKKWKWCYRASLFLLPFLKKATMAKKNHGCCDTHGSENGPVIKRENRDRRKTDPFFTFSRSNFSTIFYISWRAEKNNAPQVKKKPSHECNGNARKSSSRQTGTFFRNSLSFAKKNPPPNCGNSHVVCSRRKLQKLASIHASNIYFSRRIAYATKCEIYETWWMLSWCGLTLSCLAGPDARLCLYIY